MIPPQPIEILICQQRTCRKQGSAKVLAAFQSNTEHDIIVTGCGCLGKCGNGPNVLMLPTETWYDRVRSSDIPAILAACTDRQPS